MFFVLLIFQPSDFITDGIIEGIHLRLETRVVTGEGLPLLGEIILLFALPFWLNISVHDGILDIVNILLDWKRILFKARVYQWFIGKLLLHSILTSMERAILIFAR